jgi:hypothetical protein
LPGVFQTCAVSTSIESIAIPERLKKKTDGPAGHGVAVGPAYSAGVRAAVPLPVPACSAPAAHWPLEDQLCPSRLKSYLQGQGRLTRPPRDGSLRIHLSPGPSGRTVGMKSQVLVDRLLPAGSPSMSDCSDTGVSVVTGRPAPAQTEPSLIAQLWVRLQQRHAPVSSL